MIFVFSAVLIMAIITTLLIRSAITRLAVRPARWVMPCIVVWCVVGALALYVYLGAPLIVPLLMAS